MCEDNPMTMKEFEKKIAEDLDIDIEDIRSNDTWIEPPWEADLEEKR